MQEFTHSSNNCLHRTLTSGEQAAAESHNYRIVAFGGECWHVQGFSQEHIAGLRNRAFPGPLARLSDAWIEPCISDQLFC